MFLDLGSTDCCMDLAILDGRTPLVFSLVDIAVRNKKACAMIVSQDKYVWTIKHTDQENTTFYLNRDTRFQFKSTKHGDLSHTIIKNRDLSDYCINWEGINDIDCLVRFIQNEISLPVTPEIVEKGLESSGGYYASAAIEPLQVFSRNPQFKNLSAFKVNRNRLVEVIENMTELDLVDNGFDWDSLETIEDYLFNFLTPIKDRLEKSIKVLYNPDKVSPNLESGEIKLLKGQIPIAQAGIETLATEKFAYFGCEQGFGKEAPLDTKLLTPTGWTTMGEAYVGMDIIGKDGKSHKVTGVYPQGKKPAYEITFQDGTKTRCGIEHLWSTRNREERSRNKPFKTRTLQELLDTGILYDGGRSEFEIPIMEPAEFPEAELDIDPYLFGVSLVDCGSPQYIPDKYLFSSISQRKELLAGLMDSDGSCDDQTSFYGCLEVEGFCDLVRSLGGITIKNEDKILVKTTFNPFKFHPEKHQWAAETIGKFIKKVEYIEDVEQQCISVSAEDSLYVTDDYIVTHNTYTSIKTNNGYFLDRKPNFVTLLTVPQITIPDWIESIKKCTPNVQVLWIKKTDDFIKLCNHFYVEGKWRFDKPTYIITGKETFKLDYAKKPGIIVKESFLTEYRNNKLRIQRMNDGTPISAEACLCPKCGEPLVNKYRKELEFLCWADFDKKPKKSTYKCAGCDEVLWEPTYKKTKKCSLIKYIRTKNIQFDSIIVDEVHESANSSSIIGTATRMLIAKHAPKVLLLSGTSNNGYASSWHNLLMALMPHKLYEDDCIREEDFIRKYGTLLAVDYDGDSTYKSYGKAQIKDSKFKQIEGINPILFTKYLANNFIFATLADLGEDMPDLLEKYVPITLESNVAKSASDLAEDIRSANALLYSMYENQIVRHYVNNPKGWNSFIVSGLQGEKTIVPKNIETSLSKEDEIVKQCLQEHSENRKSVIYTDFTGVNTSAYQSGVNVPQRLKTKLEAKGLRVLWLKANTVKPVDRRDYLKKNEDKYDVLICNPTLVKVGLNLIQFHSFMVYTPSYQVNRIEQAIRRGYRVNATKENRIFYYYYENSIEKPICERMQLKKVESKAIEGKFNFEVEETVKRTSSALAKNISDVLQR